jgi:hypothetical protein
MRRNDGSPPRDGAAAERAAGSTRIAPAMSQTVGAVRCRTRIASTRLIFAR